MKQQDSPVGWLSPAKTFSATGKAADEKTGN